MFSEIKECRVCGSKNLEKYLNLGALPLANNLVEPGKQESDPVFPLEVMFCGDCCLSQLSVVADPKLLFSDYAYRTSISRTFQEHFKAMAETAKEWFPNTGDCLVVDIASNDGCMLKQFKDKGFKVLGVDPAENLAKIAEENGVPTIVEFWSEEIAEKIRKEHGKACVIAASNVFAHVNDVHGFLKAVKQVLDEKGIFVVEVPYALNLIEKNEFDTIYHEHLSYFLVKPLLKLFESEGLKVFDVQEIPIHGGSIRVLAKHSENTEIKEKKETIQAFLESEKQKGLHEIEAYKAFAKKSLEVKTAFIELMDELKKAGKRIAGYGAAAKASTLLNYCGIGTNHIEFIVDDSPTKQGRAFAGNRVPIVSGSMLEKEKPGCLVLFAWTIARELIEKTPEHRERKGEYLIPMPFPRIIRDAGEL